MRRSVPALVLVLLTLTLVSEAPAQQRGLSDAQVRSAEVEVPRLVALLELTPGATIADVGAGFGAWTIQFSRWTGPDGRVYATEIGDRQLESLRETAEREGLSNVTVVEGVADATNLPPACCDGILVRDAFHHFTEPEAMILSLAAALKPGGRLAIIDFPPRANSSVPDGVPADRGGHGVPPEVVRREVGAALTHVTTIPDWSAGSRPASLFALLFEKP